MRPSIATTALCMAATLWAIDGRAQRRPVPVHIAGIEAKLFYENTGRFSANIIDNPKIVLWNVTVGEGTVEGPSNNTLVVIRLSGPPKGFAEGLGLRLIARTESDTLLDRDIDVGAFNSAGNSYAPFWLEDTGCDPVIIEVELTMGEESHRKTVHIPFACGE